MTGREPVQALRFEPLTAQWLPEVARLESRVHSHPWSERNFSDALAAGYEARILIDTQGVAGYFVAMLGVEEVHLLNLSLRPSCQGQGLGRLLLDTLVIWARSKRAQWVWLEVRASNKRAQHVYERFGMRRVGERKAYYAAGASRREDAVVMSLKL